MFADLPVLSYCYNLTLINDLQWISTTLSIENLNFVWIRQQISVVQAEQKI